MNNKELERYVIKNFSHLFNEEERITFRLLVKYSKVNTLQTKDENKLAFLFEKLQITSHDLEMAQAIDRDSFISKTVDRILNEENIFINRCPFCGQLARTPKAVRAKCGHNWADFQSASSSPAQPTFEEE